MTMPTDDRTALLGACRLFTGVAPEGLAALAGRATEIDFPTGHVIARQGEIGTGFFVIVDGGVRVVRDGAVIARLGHGDFFGELSVLDRQPRNASVVAETPVRCLALASWEFDAAVAESPGIALAIMRGLAGRLRDATEAARH